MMTNEHWMVKLTEATGVKAAIDEADARHLFPYTLPNVAAAALEIQRAEELLGFSLDVEYRSFLLAANGWKAFYQAVSLFGTNELLGGGLMPLALQALELLRAGGALEASGVDEGSLIPVAVSEDDVDVFVCGRPGSREAGRVIWFAGEEIERFAGFGEFFDSMIEYERRRLRKLTTPN